MNIGIILPHLSDSQIRDEVFFIINSHTGKTDNSFIIYFENGSPCYTSVAAPVMNISEFRFFKGRAIHFSLSSLPLSLSTTNNCEHVLYAYDLDWLAGKIDFIENIRLYRSPDIKVYTRSESYADLISKYANIDVKVKTLEELMLNE